LALPMYHYTDDAGFKGIGAAPVWKFHAKQPPPEDHPYGAYFTDYDETTAKLANKLRVPRQKIAYVFAFVDRGDLLPLPGGRGERIFYSKMDYDVVRERQVHHRTTGL
jgi:hypothetical protein